VALAAKALIGSVIEPDSPAAQVVTQPQHFAGARRQPKELLIREEWSDGQCKRAAEKKCPVGLLNLRHSSAAFGFVHDVGSSELEIVRYCER
jgi:hypothetical protein